MPSGRELARTDKTGTFPVVLAPVGAKTKTTEPMNLCELLFDSGIGTKEEQRFFQLMVAKDPH
jgi:hypothetical protein